MVDFSHLSKSAQDKIKAEMSAGRKRLKQHAPIIAQVQANLAERQRETGQELNVTAEDLVAAQAARERAIVEDAEDTNELATLRQKQKEIADQIEALTGRKGYVASDEVQDEATRLLAEDHANTAAEPQRAIEQQETAEVHNGENPVTGDANTVPDNETDEQRETRLARLAEAEKAREEAQRQFDAANEANKSKEASDRLSNDDPNIVGYDNDGEPIYRTNTENGGANEPAADARTEVTAAQQEQEQEQKASGRKGRQKATPANAVGTGPKSE